MVDDVESRKEQRKGGILGRDLRAAGAAAGGAAGAEPLASITQWVFRTLELYNAAWLAILTEVNKDGSVGPRDGAPFGGLEVCEHKWCDRLSPAHVYSKWVIEHCPLLNSSAPTHYYTQPLHFPHPKSY